MTIPSKLQEGVSVCTSRRERRGRGQRQRQRVQEAERQSRAKKTPRDASPVRPPASRSTTLVATHAAMSSPSHLGPCPWTRRTPAAGGQAVGLARSAAPTGGGVSWYLPVPG